MAKIRQRDTAAELAVRGAASAVGVRLAPPARRLPGSLDLVNFRRKLVVFVNGCFWHGHVNCAKATVPKRNRAFWLEKFKRNRTRDRAAARELRRLGFSVVTIWECESENAARLATRMRRLDQ